MNDFQRYLAEEFAEDYEDGRLSRRDALKLIASVTGSLVVANSILAACAPPAQTASPAATVTARPATNATGAISQPASSAAPPTGGAASETPPDEIQAGETATQATQSPGSVHAYGTVMPDDPAVEAGMVEFPDAGTTLQAYLARPRAGGSFPVALVCHENRGLTEHIQDVARRLAKAGYVALAVDLLSRQGGSATLSAEQVPGILGNLPPEQFVQDFLAGWRFLQGQSFAQSGRVGMTGFCFGGGVTWRVATQMPELGAAVPFYGPHPPVEDVPKISAAVLAIYGERDQRINQGIPAVEEAMKQHNKIYEKVIYPNADHAFFNDTGSRYNPQAAQDAWSRLLGWFEKYV
jgi:carboxymethylenebutenolidase